MTERKKEDTYIRFNVLHRIAHILVMIGFIGLAVTGFSLKFSCQWWAQIVAGILGGAAALGAWHRFFALITYSAVLLHILWAVYYKLVLKSRLTGPNSIFPNRGDKKALGLHLRYLFGRKTEPRFQRFTYWEKADYWALFIGMNTMGLTGLMLWFPEWFALFLPGYFINLAAVLHLYEAILAVAIKFVVHIVTTHIRPEVWPMDKSIFTGKTTKERIEHEHPGEWEQLNTPAAPAPDTAETS